MTSMIDPSGVDITNTILATLGIELTEITKERVVASMPVTPKTHQPFAIMHGGVSVVIAETIASAGSTLFIDTNQQHAVGLEINANHIRSKSDGVVHAVGVPLHVGRRTIVWDIRIYDEQERLICISRCTIAIVDNKESK